MRLLDLGNKGHLKLKLKRFPDKEKLKRFPDKPLDSDSLMCIMKPGEVASAIDLLGLTP